MCTQGLLLNQGEMCHLLLHPLVADTTQLYRFNKGQSGKRSSTKLQNVRHCGIITHRVNGLLFPASPFCLFLRDPPGSGARRGSCELICNYLKQHVKYKVWGRLMKQHSDVSVIHLIYVEFKLSYLRLKLHSLPCSHYTACYHVLTSQS